MEKIDGISMRIDNQQEELYKVDSLSQTLTSKADSLDVFTRDIRHELANMNERILLSINTLKHDFEDTMKLTLRDMKTMEI